MFRFQRKITVRTAAEMSAARGATLLQDRAYIDVLDKAKGIWVDGSLEDTLVTLAK